MLERRVDTRDFDRFAPAWGDLARRAARTPFESPAWLLPWLRAYGSAGHAILVTWWRGNDLVGVAPLMSTRATRLGVAVRELSFWGRTETPLRGWVDIVADSSVTDDVAADFVDWLAGQQPGWDLFHYLHLAHTSPTLAALARAKRAWRNVSLSGVLHSLEYDLPLADDPEGRWHPLGPKARHEIRREIRLYGRRLAGRVDEVGDPETVVDLVAELRSLLAARWGDREAYFRRDPRFGGFLVDALRSSADSGQAWAHVARDPSRIAACLIMLGLGPSVAAILIGQTTDPEYRPLSLGKCLFSRAIETAHARGYRTFSFLTENGYKRSFWHAEGRPTESGFVARGGVGAAIATYVTVRRVMPQALTAAVTGRRRVAYRP